MVLLSARVLAAIGYVSEAARWPDGLTARNVTDALVTYDGSLITPSSRFVRFLRGERSAISVDEKRGYDRFKRYGCVGCHQGLTTSVETCSNGSARWTITLECEQRLAGRFQRPTAFVIM